MPNLQAKILTFVHLCLVVLSYLGEETSPNIFFEVEFRKVWPRKRPNFKLLRQFTAELEDRIWQITTHTGLSYKNHDSK